MEMVAVCHPVMSQVISAIQFPAVAVVAAMAEMVEMAAFSAEAAAEVAMAEMAVMAIEAVALAAGVVMEALDAMLHSLVAAAVAGMDRKVMEQGETAPMKGPAVSFTALPVFAF